MGSERYPLLLLLAAIAIHGPGVSPHATILPADERPDVANSVVEMLRASVQERISASGQAQQDSDVVKRQLAQWYNFPNFNNQNCIRGNWKNC
jgi:hypothetical protein